MYLGQSAYSVSYPDNGGMRVTADLVGNTLHFRSSDWLIFLWLTLVSLVISCLGVLASIVQHIKQKHTNLEDRTMVHYTYNEINSPFTGAYYMKFCSHHDKVINCIIGAVIAFGAVTAVYTLISVYFGV